MSRITTLEDRMARLMNGPSGSPVERVQAAMAEAQNFGQTEPGLIGSRHQVVKLTQDGGIDIFVDGNIGVRVEPKTGTINLFGQVQHHASSMREWIAEDSVTEAKRAWVVRCEGRVEVEGRTVSVKATKDLTVQSAETLSVHAAKDMTITGEQKITVDTRNHVDVRTVGNVSVYAKHHEIPGAPPERRYYNGNISVVADGNLNLVAGGNVKIKAGGTIDLE